MSTIVRVAFAGKMPEPLDYLVPPEWPGAPVLGVRVRAPVGSRVRCGIVVGHVRASAIAVERLPEGS